MFERSSVVSRSSRLEGQSRYETRGKQVSVIAAGDIG